MKGESQKVRVKSLGFSSIVSMLRVETKVSVSI